MHLISWKIREPYVSYDGRRDRFYSVIDVEIIDDEKLIFFELEMICKAKQHSWGAGKILFPSEKNSKDYVESIRNYINQNDFDFKQVIIEKYEEVRKQYENHPKLNIDAMEVRKQLELPGENKYRWKIQLFIVSERKFLYCWVKSNHPYLLIKSNQYNKINWNSSTWQPGWYDELRNEIKKLIPEWKY